VAPGGAIRVLTASGGERRLTMVLKRLGVLSVAKFVGVFYAGVGLLVGLMFAGFSSLIGMAGAELHDLPGWIAPMFGIGAIVFLPLLYGVLGFAGGAILAGLYNVFSGVMGGIEMELEARP
jgi:hypothetical protein